MYGLTDDIIEYKEDIEFLQKVIKNLLPHVPESVAQLTVAALKERKLKPRGVKG